MALLRRIADIALACALLVPAVPLLALACIAIALEDGAPFVFTQRRVGRYERIFTIYKLRTMSKAQCADAPAPQTGTDARITAVGRFLRKTSIDELPQLLNVLRGDMTFVGPRPEMQLMTRRYEPWQHLRHLVTPGITCIWQTELRKTVPLHRPEATALDLKYIRTASPQLDGALLFRTVSSVLFQKGAH